MQKTIGGDRLGSGKKMTVELHNYGRSTHNLSRAWRSSMAPGTLVPFLVEPTLNGDTWDINVSGLVRTLPTIAPLFGSFKLQIDFFLAPMRLYNRQLHNNKLGIGRDMKKVIFPKMNISASNPIFNPENPNAQQINPSSILAYLGIRGLGTANWATYITRQFDAQPFLAYWDIFKNYYANKMEENAYVISNDVILPIKALILGASINTQEFKERDGRWLKLLPTGTQWGTTKRIRLYLFTSQVAPYISTNWAKEIIFRVKAEGTVLQSANVEYFYTLEQLAASNQASIYYVQEGFIDLDITFQNNNPAVQLTEGHVYVTGETNEMSSMLKPQLESFPLEEIDNMREEILIHPNSSPYTVGSSSQTPFGTPFQHHMTHNITGDMINFAAGEMCGLAVKTYQSDRFNNWVSSEWIAGANGISELTKVDTSDGLKIDALILAEKLHKVLNRIAISGGSYYDWQEAVWGDRVKPSPETPVFVGGTSQEVIFTEVTSTAETDEYNPLGTLAGKGYSQNNSKQMHITVDEPSFLMGIVSLTPRLDYSQGNKWFTHLETMDDLHKPALDGIGFQELITEEMAAFDTSYELVVDPDTNTTTDRMVQKSAGKQPSWIHYMTSQNECYGNFAEPHKEMYMTLARNYEMDNNGNISDLTTYIDPEKFNSNFARKDIGAQNFWVQLGLDITARRKMSAKQIPNL